MADDEPGWRRSGGDRPGAATALGLVAGCDLAAYAASQIERVERGETRVRG